MSTNPTPAGSMTRPLRLARRISRWGLARLLRFAWLRATGRQAEPEVAGCRDMDPPGDDRLLPETVRTLIMALECLAADGRDGLRAFLADRARPWFAELCQHLFHFAGEDNRDELEWLRWATQKRGYRPLEALLDSVLRRMDQPARSRSRTGEHRVPSTERIRELRQDPEHQTALQRARGRRRLLCRLTGHIHALLLAAGTALSAERDAAKAAHAPAAGTVPAPPDNSTADGTSFLRDAPA